MMQSPGDDTRRAGRETAEDRPVKLYYSRNLNPRVAVAVARHLRAPVNFVRADPMNPAHREAFRPLNPNTRVPVLAEDGKPPLWETDAIACRLSALAGSDFWLLDLGTDFFHWPGQMLWKKEIKKGQSCDVLESRPANPGVAGYGRIVSWIDRDTGGIVQAEAYDARGKRLKDFEVKEFSKVKGEWRVTEIEMRNVQTKSRTQIVFDYGK